VEANSSPVANVSICHVTQGSGEFILMSVPPSALDAHMRHGDARPGDPVPERSGMKFAADCTQVPFVVVTIGFDGLTVRNAPFVTYTQSGFTVTPISSTTAAWKVMTTSAHTPPFVYFERPASSQPLSGQIQVNAGGSAFTFRSVDLYSSITPIPHTFEGLSHGTTVFTVSGTVPNTFGNFATVVNPRSTDLIDQLVITLTNPGTPCCPNPMGLDNIVLTH
jgi:hypothetical protein